MQNDHSLPLGKRVIIPLTIVGILIVIVAHVGALWVKETIRQKPSSTSSTTQSSIQIGPKKLNADKMEELINMERQKVGLPPLAHSETLRASACAKLDHMVQYDYWSHNAPDGTEPWHFFQVVGYDYTKAAENLAYGQLSEQSVITGWMNSQTHRDNVVGNYAESGICTRLEKFQGMEQTLTVHHFGTR